MAIIMYCWSMMDGIDLCSATLLQHCCSAAARGGLASCRCRIQQQPQKLSHCIIVSRCSHGFLVRPMGRSFVSYKFDPPEKRNYNPQGANAGGARRPQLGDMHS